MNQEIPVPQKPALPSRLLSLDVFRGLTVMAMILVNNPGDWGHIYAPLEHSAWNGCTLADLIFPFFLFIVGVSIVYAMDSKKANPAQHNKLIITILKRTSILFFLGLFMSIFWFFDVYTVRIPGILQRIALVFGICGIIFIKTGRKTQLWIFWLILIVYYLMMTLIPVPPTGHANLMPTTNLGAWVDRTLLGTAHLWKESITWDPEGILGTLPSVATGIFGMLAGTWLKRKDESEGYKVAWMFSFGVVAIIAGLIWGSFFPINKALWTSSFVLYTGGLAAIVLALFYWIIDAQGYKNFTKPFVIYGINAITVYFFSGLIARSMNMAKVELNGKVVSVKDYVFQSFYAPYLSPINASFAWSISFVLFWMGVLWLMYKRNIIIKV